MNGFFKLVINTGYTAVELHPPKDGGEPIALNELTAYLQMQKIEQIDVVKLNQALATLEDKPVVIPLMPKTMYPVAETFVLQVSDDCMQAVARFYPASNGGNELTVSELLRDLEYKKILFGIDQKAVNDYINHKQYCTDIVLANGKLPVHGKDASIEYFFNTSLSTKPKMNEDGSVDFFNLDTINHCKQGDLLARLTKAVPSIAGTDVFGNAVKGRDVKVMSLKFGRNMKLSENKCELFSAINGHVSLVGNSVFVSDVYEVEDVGTATGNIESEGSVLVRGNVQSGFMIKAKGNVEVRGVVEGAIIEAGGDVIIDRGVNGMGKGVIEAGGRVISKFIENATVTSGAYIQTESILHSKVNARTEIEVCGKRGSIAGGVVRATEKITCKTLGSPMGADTAVEVGVEPIAKERHQVLRKEISDLQKSMKDIRVVIDNCQKKVEAGTKFTSEQMKYVQTLIQSLKQMTLELRKKDAEYNVLEESMRNNANACIIVNGEVYAGTKVTIADASTIVKGGMKYCRLIKESGDVKLTAV